MNKEKRVIITLAIIAIVVIGLTVFRKNTLGCIIRSITTATTNMSEVGFEGKKGEKILILFSSKIKSGDLECYISASKGNVVFKIDQASRLETHYVFEQDDTYTLTANYKDFTGKFNVKVFEYRY